MNKLLLGSVALVGFSLAAARFAGAADMPVKARIAPSPVVAYGWTGFYVGAHAGYGFGRMSTDFTLACCPASPSIPATAAPDGKGFIGGAQAGYNYQFGTVVIGLEAEISHSRLRGNATSASPNGFFMEPTEQQIRWLDTVRARVGILPADRLLVFATGGVAFGEVAVATSFLPTGLGGGNCTNSSCGAGAISGRSTGWAAGGGLEYALSNELSFKGEYLFVDLGTRSTSFPRTFTTEPLLTNSHFATHVVRLGLNLHFYSNAVVTRY